MKKLMLEFYDTLKTINLLNILDLKIKISQSNKRKTMTDCCCYRQALLIDHKETVK
jgi:hypothetical protein